MTDRIPNRILKHLERDTQNIIGKFWRAIFGLSIMTLGYVVLFVSDWKIGLAIFLIHWAHNIERPHVQT